MKPEALVVAVGIPPEIESDYVQAFTTLQKAQNASLILSSKLHPRERYTDAYAADLYERLAYKLKRRRLLCDSADKKSLILLYLDRDDGSEVSLLGRFRIEALVTPLSIPDFASAPMRTRNQRNELINRLLRETRSTISQARNLLGVIAEEVTSRANKTCLLLPPRRSARNSIESSIESATQRGLGKLHRSSGRS